MKYRAGDTLTVKLNDRLADVLNENFGNDRIQIIYGMEVVKHEPAPFDWSTVKPGMAFTFTGTRGGEQQRVYYCFTSKDDDMLFSMDDHAHPQALRSFGDHTLTRAPEHDIEVAS